MTSNLVLTLGEFRRRTAHLGDECDIEVWIMERDQTIDTDFVRLEIGDDPDSPPDQVQILVETMLPLARLVHQPA